MDGPIDPDCGCYTCRTFSIAYLFHLNRVRETSGWQLLGLHNLHFYMQLMRRMREHILSGTWLAFYHAQRDVLDARDRYGAEPKHIPKPSAGCCACSWAAMRSWCAMSSGISATADPAR